MRRRNAVLVLALLIVTAGTALAGTTSLGGNAIARNAAAQPSAGGEQTVAVGATGQVRTAPNQAILRVAVTARADTVEAVRQQLAQNASQMRTALQDAGLATDQIVSAQYDIGRNYEHEENPDAPTFRGQHSFVVTLNETDRAGEILVTAVQNGATEVEDVRFTITSETRRRLRQQALANAVANARSKAGVMANGTGLTLTGVHTVRTMEVSLEPGQDREVAFATAGGGAGGDVATSFESGKVTVTARVTVVYNATDS